MCLTCRLLEIEFTHRRRHRERVALREMHAEVESDPGDDGGEDDVVVRLAEMAAAVGLQRMEEIAEEHAVAMLLWRRSRRRDPSRIPLAI